MRKNIIYMHYSTISMKSYIGLTTRTMDKRWKEHLSKAFATNNDGSFKSTVKFHKAIRKYPLDSWLHIELYQYRNDGTELHIEEYEKFFIAKYDTFKNGYNTTLGGDGVNGEVHRKLNIANRKNSVKGYNWNAPLELWQVSLSYLGKMLNFGYFKNEADAKDRADYLMSLNDEELLKEYEEYKTSKKDRVKGYSFSKRKRKYRVQMSVNGKLKSFGYYTTEQEAIDRVQEVRNELGLYQ